jgi:tetratricopeptide (TPR) repeat protein
VWQELRAELHPKGLEIVTVALDARGAPAAGPWIEKAQPQHPSLIDESHELDRLGVVNVPTGIWIDEVGTIVRPPETAYPRRPSFKDREVPADATPIERERVALTRELNVDADRYVAALRDWVAKGAASRYALTPDEVVRRSRPRPLGEATADAHFALGRELHAMGQPDAAIEHFREAHRLHPTNWTYRRDAWAMAGPEYASIYGTTWLDDVKREGVQNYYPRLEL